MVTGTTAFEIGSLVRARGREWVVLPSDDPAVLQLRPLGGTDADACGIVRGLETVVAATFDLPDARDLGDSGSAMLLRDAVRLNFRAGAGPFRSFGRIAVEPRSYQLVPLMMALRLDPIRLLIADDVGIGKTVEAGLIAREMIDRGEVDRMVVICPPHLCEQWQHELHQKFHIDAEVIRPGTVARLERPLGPNTSVFEAYPYTIVSVDYIKSGRRRDDFVRVCPQFVIVDEAHTCAVGASGGRGSQQLRHQLVRELVNPETEAGRARHLILTTATPHSGVEDAFRSLLTLLDPAFSELPADPSAITSTHPLRRKLADHLIQRRRPDIRQFLEDTTTFPVREVAERTYSMSRDYNAFFEHARDYATQMIRDAQGQSEVRQRVSWWAALALLQSVTSSPAAAAMSLRNKSRTLAAAASQASPKIPDAKPDLSWLDELGASSVFDTDAVDSEEVNDLVPGVDIFDEDAPNTSERRRLKSLAEEADALAGAKDAKLQAVIAQLKSLLAEGFRPIVYCRYITTAHYLREQLEAKLRGVTVAAVTGELPAEERIARVEDLGTQLPRVLIATDCLSEGVNLQEHFDSVIHYDLAWNPTRHEQREGRVDRFGQAAPIVRTVMLYGEDNPVDLSVMNVLLRKAESIRRSLGVTVSVPQGTGAVMNAIFDAIFHGKGASRQLTLDMDDGGMAQDRLGKVDRELDREWKRMEEKASRTIFQQRSINPEMVKRELDETNASLGNHVDVQRLVSTTVSRFNATLERQANGSYLLPTSMLPSRIRADIDRKKPLPVGFELPLLDNVRYLSRTDPLVESICSYLVDGALDPHRKSPANRASVIRTRDVSERTTIVLLRLRIHLRTADRSRSARTLLAEEVITIGWRGTPDHVSWLTEEEIVETLVAKPIANMDETVRANILTGAVAEYAALDAEITRIARERAASVLAAHRRVRDKAQITGAGQLAAEPMLPADALGVFVFLPIPRLG